MSNHYDDIAIDIAAKHNELDRRKNRHPFGRLPLTKRLLHHTLRRLRLYDKLVDSGFIRRWFSEFNFYWQHELDGRPLKFHDFFFLHGHYRTKYQNVGLTDETNSAAFLADWQKPANIYQIFSCAYQYAANPFSYLPYRRLIKPNMRILEYGAGFAPITTSLIHYYPKKLNLTIADIPQHSFHYAKWKLASLGVNTIDIEPANLPDLKTKYDIIFIITVLEHLLNPLEVIRHLTNQLNPGGFLVFDYIKSDAEGLDTKKSLFERELVIQYILKEYDTIKTPLNPHQTIKPTIVQKK